MRRHTRRVFNLCYRFTGNPTEAEDLSQEVFLRIYRTLASYRPAYGAFPTWLTSVTRNLLVDHYRRTRRDRMTDSIDDAMPQAGGKTFVGADAGQAGAGGRIERAIAAGLSRLSPELREAVILRDLQGLEYSEIQDVLQVPEGTVKSRINRGRIELAQNPGRNGLAAAELATGAKRTYGLELHISRRAAERFSRRAAFARRSGGVLRARCRCAALCAELVAQVAGWSTGCSELDSVEAPPQLVAKILDATLGPAHAERIAGAAGSRGFPMLWQPRFAMGMATVVATAC